jgi:hypothetical protein
MWLNNQRVSNTTIVPSIYRNTFGDWTKIHSLRGLINYIDWSWKSHDGNVSFPSAPLNKITGGTSIYPSNLNPAEQQNHTFQFVFRRILDHINRPHTNALSQYLGEDYWYREIIFSKALIQDLRILATENNFYISISDPTTTT